MSDSNVPAPQPHDEGAPCAVQATQEAGTTREAAARQSRRRRRRHLVAATTLLAALLLTAATVFAWAPNSFDSGAEVELLGYTNQARVSAGLRSLTMDSVLRSHARSRSKDMIVRDYFSHDIPPDGHSVFDELSDAGYCFELAGENIGWNTYPDDQSAYAVHKAFMGSSGHRANILNSRWNVAGMGAYKGDTAKKMFTELFADKCGAATPRPTATPKPTPRPTATPKPTPRPTATPRPTVKPTVTPRPTTKPVITPKPTVAPTAAPTLPPTASPSPPPTPTSSPTPDAADESPDVVIEDPVESAGPELTPSPRPTLPPGPASLRIRDIPPPQGLLESILADVLGLFFGF
ncbi:MAG TPA: CAP domain-containing protein [Candidatus Limnocylindrales bacterium]|nr:CAP domain-containing protein [Candidatus Limnocylindrales bacterium]